MREEKNSIKRCTQTTIMAPSSDKRRLIAAAASFSLFVSLSFLIHSHPLDSNVSLVLLMSHAAAAAENHFT